MKKITKKEFINTLANNKSMFIGSYFNVTPERINAALQSANITFDDTAARTVTAVKSTALIFSNGSRLDLNQDGQNTYHKYINNGLIYLIQENIVYDKFDKKFCHNWLIYVIKVTNVAA